MMDWKAALYTTLEFAGVGVGAWILTMIPGQILFWLLVVIGAAYIWAIRYLSRRI